MSRFARGDFARALCQRAHHALLARKESQQAVGFSPVCVTENDGGGAEGVEGGHGGLVIGDSGLESPASVVRCFFQVNDFIQGNLSCLTERPAA